jgi:hypothetical protein
MGIRVMILPPLTSWSLTNKISLERQNISPDLNTNMYIYDTKNINLYFSLLGGFFQEAFVLGGLLSRGFLSGGLYLGGFCPRPSKPNPFGTDKFVQFRQVFGLHMFKLHRHLVEGTVKSVWFRQVFGLLRVWFRQVSLYHGFLLVFQSPIYIYCSPEHFNLLLENH